MTTTYQTISSNAPHSVTVNIRDGEFENEQGACYVRGYYGEPFMDQFSGVGISDNVYRMKAVYRDGIFYILNPNLCREWKTTGEAVFSYARISIPIERVMMCEAQA